MTAFPQPLYFNLIHFDSKTGNLALTDAVAPVYTSESPLTVDDVRALLGNDLADQLLRSPAPEGSGWEFQLEGEWQLWTKKIGSVVSHLLTEQGAESGFVAYAYNPPEGDRLFLDIQKRDAAQGDVTLALSAVISENGNPAVAVHDADGGLVTTLEVGSDGKVSLLPGNRRDHPHGQRRLP